MTEDDQKTSRPRALRRRLVGVLVGVLLVFTTGLALASTLALRSQDIARLDNQLIQASLRLTSDPPGERDLDDGPHDRPGDADLDTPRQPWFGQNAGTIIVSYSGGQVDRAGYVTQDGFQDLTDAQVADLESVPDDGRPHSLDVTGLGDYRAVSATTDQGERSIVAMSTAPVTDIVEDFLLVELALGAAGVVVAGAIGTWLVRRSLRPLDAVADAAGHVSRLELARGEVADIPRVADAYTDERTEVGQVGAALNRMLTNVESSLQARQDSETQVRQFVADASHELRTPLASIRGYAELVRRSPDVVPPDTGRALDRIESEAGRMSTLVEDLLLLARLDAGRPLDTEPVDLTVLAIDAVADAHAASPAHRWELELPGTDEEDPPDLIVTGDEARLRQVLTNLLANARTHTPPGTRVCLRLGRNGPDVVVLVTDNGPGIPADLRETLFGRFVRGDAARNRTGGSTGLGLAIAQSIVTAHGGSITASDGADGGAQFEVRLPVG